MREVHQLVHAHSLLNHPDSFVIQNCAARMALLGVLLALPAHTHTHAHAILWILELWLVVSMVLVAVWGRERNEWEGG